MALRTKSVWSPIVAKADGLRILATRFRGRGMPTERYDVWMPSLGPSERLLKGFLAGDVTWREFARAYKEEILSSSEFDAANETIKNRGQKFTLRLIKHLAEQGNVTLLCQCAEDELQCHRHLLREVVLSKKI